MYMYLSTCQAHCTFVCFDITYKALRGILTICNPYGRYWRERNTSKTKQILNNKDFY